MISGFAPARLLRSAERVLRIQREQDKAAGIAGAAVQCSAVQCSAVQCVLCSAVLRCRVLLATWSECTSEHAGA